MQRMNLHQGRQPLPQPFAERLFPMHEAQVLTGLHRTTLWRLRRSGRFPAAVPLKGRRIGWRGADLLDWLRDPATWSAPPDRPAAS